MNARPAELSADVVAEFLAATALFRDLPDGIAKQIAPHVRAMDYGSGDAIQPVGRATGEIGIVFSGKVVACRVDAVSGTKERVADFGVGESFGEVGAILNAAEPTAIDAGTDSTVLFLPKGVVKQLTAQLALFSAALAKRVANRLIRLSTTALRGDRGSAPPPAAALAPIDLDDPPPGTSGKSQKKHNGIEMVSVSAYRLTDDVVTIIPARVIHEQRALPLEMNGRTLTVGFVDPFSPAPLAEIRRTIPNVDIDVVGISLDDFNHALIKLKLDSNARRGAAGPRIAADSVVYDMTDSERDADNAVRVMGDEVINLATAIIVNGIGLAASDIHVENDATGIRVRYRVGGVLVDWDQFVPASFAKGLIARFKVLAGLDITERRRPQDGRIGLRADRREVDLRVSTVPAMRGEKIVMRIFEAANMMRPLDQVFIHPGTLTAVREALNLPYGAIVVAGPTGSGKSSTLYAALGERKRTRPDTNIVMLEDPVEYRLEGVTQIQVNANVGLNYAQILRSVLRQDPDVLMVGEVRDGETAELALEAAMTGHLLLTSLHANNAFAAIQRLQNVGCQQEAIAQSLALILVQRLVTRLCSKCVITEAPPPILHETLAKRGIVESSSPVPLPRSRGCNTCNQTGIAGRIAVVESLKVDDRLRHGLMAGTNLGELERAADENGTLFSFRKAVALMMTRQLISPSEALLAVTQ